MSYANFEKWMHTKRELTVTIMDQNQVIAEVKDAKALIGCDYNESGFPSEFTILKGKAHINIGDRYINQIIKSGDYWCIFVDGHEHYLIS